MSDGSVTLVGLPYDASSSFMRGPALAPPAIREALRSDASNMWSELGIDLGIGEAIRDEGDIDFPDGADERESIEARITLILERGERPIALGGDHSVTYPIVRAVRRRHPRLQILHIDAHPDLYSEYEGDLYSHASPFARIMEEGLADRLVQVGIRTMNAHQRDQARRFGVEVHEMRDWRGVPPLSFDGDVYLSIDVDALDPAHAPGVSHREPGGLTVRDVIRMVQSIDAPIAGADIVELNPRNDPHGLTAIVCAKLLKEVAGRMLLDGRAAADDLSARTVPSRNRVSNR